MSGMKSSEIRDTFFSFFESKNHKIVPSAPIVLKDDPTLMFTNAGMNQFKDLFLGNKKAQYKRIADTQKCLRVSGKHNDLEEVGRDSYHHTMFEMLGNWSIGDYFKEEAIAWAFELLIHVYGLDKERLYVTVFGGDEKDGLPADTEAKEIWKKYLPEERILFFGKKDNFWEMGDTGPCGPCSELHYDIRSDAQRAEVSGVHLVNNDNPLLIEIWNNVFIQFNRKADGSLEELPDKHIDTGMGFERLCMALQGKTSNYDTDIFSPFIEFLSNHSGIPYTSNYQNESMSDIAMRVASDHIRAVSFAIADGEIPGNSGAAYVIRRILRRAVRYNYSFLNQKEPVMHLLVPMLAEKFKDVFPELEAQKTFVQKVVLEEEKSFLRTLEEGLRRIDNLNITDGTLEGKVAFELYDTYGFPFDLTRLIAEEKGWSLDVKGFQEALQSQKERSRADAKKETGDWHLVNKDSEVEFVGYELSSVSDVQIQKYRILKQKDQEIFQLVLNKTPFYAEGGGQVGDTGTLRIGGEQIKVLDTRKENDLIIHYVDRLPENLQGKITADIDVQKRRNTEYNHSATHLLHAALRQVLGTHVAQKGSLVRNEYLRFDFSHFQKMSDSEIAQVEDIVNHKIRENVKLTERRNLPIAEAKAAGAMMLFGEKYGETVRMITFDPAFSNELCGGCHVQSTGQIGYFKIKSESAIAAGVRRIEAVTADFAEAFVKEQFAELEEIKAALKNPQNPISVVNALMDEVKDLRKEVDQLKQEKVNNLQSNLVTTARVINGMSTVISNIGDADPKAVKTLAYNILTELKTGLIALGSSYEGKAQIMVLISDDLVAEKSINAGKLIREIAPKIDGGGGGQTNFASAGGKKPDGINQALLHLEELI